MKRNRPICKEATRWAILWRQHNLLDGKREHLLGDGHDLPLMFLTRKECRAHIKEHYGYITTRPDLKVEPHGWKTPQPVRIAVAIQYHWRIS